jgi:hypothetical protein
MILWTKFMAAAVLLGSVSLAALQPQSGDVTQEQLPPVRITNGPVVESVSDSTAIIAWSTNVNSGTTLRYGTDPTRLDKTASMPWGGFTHRVYLKELLPATTYYFQAESGKAQGTGTTATTTIMAFETRPAPDPISDSDAMCNPSD